MTTPSRKVRVQVPSPLLMSTLTPLLFGTARSGLPSAIFLPETSTTSRCENLITARNSLRRDNMVNYEVDRSVEHVQQQRGSIKRLTAAVVVNYRTTLDADGKPRREALSQEEMARIDRLVRQAVGFSANRGDELEVANTPFTESQERAMESVWWQTPEFFAMATSIARYLMVALAALLLWLLVLRPLQRRHLAQTAPGTPPVAEDGEAPAAGEPGSAGEADEPDESDGGAPVGSELQRRMRRRSAIYEHNLASLREMGHEDPRMIAMIIRGWLKKND